MELHLVRQHDKGKIALCMCGILCEGVKRWKKHKDHFMGNSTTYRTLTTNLRKMHGLEDFEFGHRYHITFETNRASHFSFIKDHKKADKYLEENIATIYKFQMKYKALKALNVKGDLSTDSEFFDL